MNLFLGRWGRQKVFMGVIAATTVELSRGKQNQGNRDQHSTLMVVIQTAAVQQAE